MAQPIRSAHLRLEGRGLNRRAARHELRARRAALRARVAEARARLRPKRSAGRSLRRRLLLLALLLLLWILLRHCNCAVEIPSPPDVGPPRPDSIVSVVDAAVATPTPVVSVARSKPRPRRRLKSRRRPTYRNDIPPPAAWLTEFRLQVSARGAQLSRCFEGAVRPGALRWTAALDAARGIVSDHQFEPVLAGAALSRSLRTCLIEVLSHPPYRLSLPDKQPSPSRVAIVIEF